MRTIETTVYKFDELSDAAKQKALNAWRDLGNFDDECTIDYCKEAAKMFGLGIDKIYYSGFSSQGDGACFEGRYKYKAGALAAVKKAWPKWTALHDIVERLQAVQKRNFYRLAAVTKHRGHYYHSGCMLIDAEDSENQYRDLKDAEDIVIDELRCFADLIYSALSDEFDYTQSDEYVTESIQCNDVEFTIDGELT